MEKTWYKIAAGVTLLLIVAPLVYIEMKGNGVDTNLLSYYGGAAGGIFTIAGVFFTVSYSQKQYENGQRNEVIPYFAVNMLKRHYASSADYKTRENNAGAALPELGTSSPDSDRYYEYKAVDYVFVIQKGNIKVQNKLTENQRRRAERPRVSIEEITKGVTAWVASNDVYQAVDYENVGNGVAVNFRIGFYRKDSKEKLYSYSISVNKGEHVTAHIYAEDCNAKSENLGSYELEIHYEDIFGNKYTQTTNIIIAYDERGLVVQTNMYQKQVMVDVRNTY